MIVTKRMRPVTKLERRSSSKGVTPLPGIHEEIYTADEKENESSSTGLGSGMKGIRERPLVRCLLFHSNKTVMLDP